jgi:phosphate transport system permease protein
MAYGTALVLIIVLISNLLANGLRKYYGRKVKNELTCRK